MEWLLGFNFFCAFCGEVVDPETYEADHTDPNTKEFQYGKVNIWAWSRKRLYEELAKCRPMHQECHWKKTQDDKIRLAEAEIPF